MRHKVRTPKRLRRQLAVESLENRRVLSGDGLELGPFLQELPDGMDRAERIAATLKSEIDTASEIVFDGYLQIEEQFDSASDVDVFKVTTPSLSDDAPSNGFLNIATWSWGTGAASIAVIADATGEPVYADLAIAPFVGALSIEVQPETTYVFAVGQTDVEGFPDGDLAGPYQIDISYWEPSPIPPEPADVESDTPADAASIDADFTMGYLNSGGDVDYFQFTATQTGQLNIILDSAPATFAEIRIEDASGVQLGSELAVFAPVESIVDVTAGETYYVSIRATEGQGHYSFLAIEGAVSTPQAVPDDAHADSIDSATDLTDFGPFAVGFGVINTADDVDWFKVAVGSFGIQLMGDTTITAELTNADGTVVQTLTAGDDILKTISEPGEVYLRVSSDSFTEPAFYDFFIFDADTLGIDTTDPDIVGPVEEVPVDPEPSVDDAVGDTLQNATPLNDFTFLGLTGLWAAEGQLNGFNDQGILDVDVFSVNFEQDSVVLIQVESSSPDIQIELLDSDGALLAEGVTELTAAIPSSGEHFVRISSANEQTSTYQLQASLEVQPATEPVTPTEPTTLTIEELAEMLGLDVSDITGEVDPDAVMPPDPNSPSSNPEIVSFEELLALLGLTPDDVFYPNSDLPADPNTVELPSDGGQVDVDTGAGVPQDVLDVDSPIDPDSADVLMGDIDGNNAVDFGDFLTMSQYFGTEQGAEWKHGSFDGDGDVDFDDFMVLSSQFGISR